MRIQETKVYQFDELSEEAQETAIDTNRDMNTDYDWFTDSFNQYIEIGAIMGIEIDDIYFSGFSSQGDGACFDGTYSYKKGSVKEITKQIGNAELTEIAQILQDIQKRYFYNLSATIKHSGHYYHKYCTIIDIMDNRSTEWILTRNDALLSIGLRKFMQWIYSSLEKEHEHLTSDEAIKESILANEYEFTATGELI